MNEPSQSGHAVSNLGSTRPVVAGSGWLDPTGIDQTWVGEI